MKNYTHQYIERATQTITDENLYFDSIVQTIYSTIRERAPFAFKLLVSARTSALLGFVNYDFPLIRTRQNPGRLLEQLNINTEEIYGSVQELDTYRKIFERQIAYWEYRPMTPETNDIVSPADSKILLGSFNINTKLFIKEKLFNFTELIGKDKKLWLSAFNNGDFSVCRLTPDKYHYNHAPVSGKVVDIYEINGIFHSCNPGALVKSISPYSKNRRVVTIIDTDVENGTRIGLVAMIEIVALMIGQIVQTYSSEKYDSPQNIEKGLFIKKGQPKSLFRPGSSTTVLVFQKDRMEFSTDLVKNSKREDVQSRFTQRMSPLVETEINARETIGKGI